MRIWRWLAGLFKSSKSGLDLSYNPLKSDVSINIPGAHLMDAEKRRAFMEKMINDLSDPDKNI